MWNSKLLNKLAQERSKLTQLISHALEHGLSIIHNEKILEQSRKVDDLIFEIQKDAL